MAMKLFGARFSIVQEVPCRRMHACRRETLGSSTTISFSASRPSVVTALEIAITLSVRGPLRNWMLTPLIGISSAFKPVLLDLRLPITPQVYLSIEEFASEYGGVCKRIQNVFTAGYKVAARPTSPTSVMRYFLCSNSCKYSRR